MTSWQRTHTCGELTTSDEGQDIILNGWVENYRDHGQVLFLDIRDRFGITQVVFDQDDAELYERARGLRAENVVTIAGKVGLRSEANINPNRVTGAIEIYGKSVSILGAAETPPFEILDKVEANEELRMRYRYLDLRRRPMADAMERRSKSRPMMRSK